MRRAAVAIACAAALLRAQAPANGAAAANTTAVPLVVLTPAPLGDELAATLRALLPAAAVRCATATELDRAAAQPGDAPACVLAFADEVLLWSLERQGLLVSVAALGSELPAGCRAADGAWLLPWSLRYTVAVLAARPPRAEPWTFEALALDRSLHGRLGLCAPDVDAAPWLAAMEEYQLGGHDEAGGFALWTTLDARIAAAAGGYAADPAQLVERLRRGHLDAAVLPEPVARSLGEVVRSESLGTSAPRARLGLAVLRGTGADRAQALAGELLARAQQPELLRTGLGPAVAAVGPFDGDAADRRLRHFAAVIRGQGGAVEDLADTLDLVFGVLFAAAVFGSYLWLRRQSRGSDRLS